MLEHINLKTDNAVISDCGKYRYVLSRVGNDPLSIIIGSRPLVFIMLNPSTADHKEDDATIRRCRNFSKKFGYDGIIVINLYAFRATKPKGMFDSHDPIGVDNDKWIKRVCQMSSSVVCAWGGNARGDRVADVGQILIDSGVKIFCLGKNKNGSPKHPLYLKNDTKLQVYLEELGRLEK